MLTGVSPSVIQALLGAWYTCPTGRRKLTRSMYVDDSIFVVFDGTFDEALEHSLRVLTEMVILGFSVNLKVGKSQNCLDHIMCHLGFVVSVAQQTLSLSAKQAAGLRQAVADTRTLTKVGGKVTAIQVEKVVGKM